MKIALCLSGQPRFVEDVAPFILKNVCDGYDVDVFCHFWFDEKLQTEPYKFGGEWNNQRIPTNAVEKVFDIYKPIAYRIESSKSFVDSLVPFQPSLERYWYGSLEDPDQLGFRNRTINNCLSYFYSLNEVNKLKKEYEYANDFKYDWVVRCRTDTVLHTKIEFESYNPSVINFSFLQGQPDGMINDWFNFAGSKEMDAFMSVFPVWQLILEKCMNETGAWCHELMHRKMVDSFGIGIHGHPIHITLPRF
jgi:hypothetical protein